MISLAEYRFLEKFNIFIQQNHETIGYVDGSEIYLLDALNQISNKNSDSNEYYDHIRDWPTKYHLSQRRTNLLKLIKPLFKIDSTILEIGCGCGALTRWLGENAGQVDAIENEINRARCTRVRCQDLKNVNVYCGDYTKTNFDKKYDIICLVGIIEYLPFAFPNLKNYQIIARDLLTRLSINLSENGIIIIAIENKLGIKYFSGCAEDHTNELFDGIIGYPDKKVITFSKFELKNILSPTYHNIDIYHCFPDYKFTNTLIIDNDSIPYIHNWILSSFENYGFEREFFFPDILGIRSLSQAHDLLNHSNSFLAIGSKNRDTFSELGFLIRKISNMENLNIQYHHYINLKEKDGLYVERKLVYPQLLNKSLPKSLSFLLNDSPLYYGENLLFGAMESLLGGKFQEFLLIFYQSLIDKYSMETYDINGYLLIDGQAIDYTFWNVIDDASFSFCDKKWGLTEPIPVDYVIFRSLFYFYYYSVPFINEKNQEKFIFKNILTLFPNISYDRLKYHLSCEEIFQSLVNGEVKVQKSFEEFPYTISIKEKIKKLNELELSHNELELSYNSLLKDNYDLKMKLAIKNYIKYKLNEFFITHHFKR